ncbi:FadR/GntR family transcriptional regulator [uncultured Lentibacter sp.]|uniref:FadR/GntR family transcriptional regulator n=1 Tax=uncultured Lentibacter sp. TaxID=1659309 RepID=UPI002622AF64|nr:FadR/GntR family transcriptional regulator [uncultured Lentibacter sp.]MCW1954616.1 FadR family transcriptional regulator [Roseobacter sp.]
MPFQPVQPEKLSRAVVRQIEQLILRGILRPGEKLPSERDLADKLNVSRPSLREAIGELQERGLLATKAGSGVYIADVLGSAFSDALIELFSSHEEAVFDYLAFRRDLEGIAAERAARLASETDLKVINHAYERMVNADRRYGAQKEAELDAAFHMSIIEASNNVVMLHMMRSIFDLLKEGVFYNRSRLFLQNTTREELLAQHKAINDALQLRDAAGARLAVETHLNFVNSALADQLKSDKNEDIARLRFEHDRDD